MMPAKTACGASDSVELGPAHAVRANRKSGIAWAGAAAPSGRISRRTTAMRANPAAVVLMRSMSSSSCTRPGSGRTAPGRYSRAGVRGAGLTLLQGQDCGQDFAAAFLAGVFLAGASFAAASFAGVFFAALFSPAPYRPGARLDAASNLASRSETSSVSSSSLGCSSW